MYRLSMFFTNIGFTTYLKRILFPVELILTLASEEYRAFGDFGIKLPEL